MAVNIEGSREILIAYLVGEIDHHTAVDMRKKIDVCVREMKPKILVLDFDSVSFMDSSGIGLVMGRYKLIKELGGTLHVVGVSERTHKIMNLAGLQNLAEITEKEAKV